jgi:hypothetical protein
MTIEYAWKYIIDHCLNELAMDADVIAREAVDTIEDALIPLIGADECEGGKR